jgi:hypothetical protein
MSLSVTYIQEINLQAQEALKLEMHAAYARYKRNGHKMSEPELKAFLDSLTLEFLEDDNQSYDPELVGSIGLEDTDSEKSAESDDPELLHFSSSDEDQDLEEQDQDLEDQDLDGFEKKDA